MIYQTNVYIWDKEGDKETSSGLHITETRKLQQNAANGGNEEDLQLLSSMKPRALFRRGKERADSLGCIVCFCVCVQLCYYHYT
jgi:hypothetical protein